MLTPSPRLHFQIAIPGDDETREHEAETSMYSKSRSSNDTHEVAFSLILETTIDEDSMNDEEVAPLIVDPGEVDVEATCADELRGAKTPASHTVPRWSGTNKYCNKGENECEDCVSLRMVQLKKGGDRLIEEGVMLSDISSVEPGVRLKKVKVPRAEVTFLDKAEGGPKERKIARVEADPNDYGVAPTVIVSTRPKGQLGKKQGCASQSEVDRWRLETFSDRCTRRYIRRRLGGHELRITKTMAPTSRAIYVMDLALEGRNWDSKWS